MGVLDQIIKMKKQGIPEADIINDLSQQGISPKEINDTLKQAQIKDAVSSTGEMGDEMQPSIMPEQEIPTPQTEEQTYSPQENYTPRQNSPQQTYSPRAYVEPAQYQQEEYQPQEQQYYPQQEGYSQSGLDTDTIIEISDQIFSEKIKKFQKQMDSSSEINVLLQTKIENISERLKKIETIIDKLQIAILEKVGSYGQNLESVKKEMSMMQDSFSKMISSPKEKQNPAENYSKEEDAFSKLKKIDSQRIPKK